ncbi:MAG: conjugal transfer protein TraD, partial [Sphingobacteriaceae bacterium]
MKEATQTRKADTRKKIMLGGLVIKAELDHLSSDSPSMLYGMFL